MVTGTKFLLLGIKRAVNGVTLLIKKAVGVSEHGVGASGIQCIIARNRSVVSENK